jgi:hypothetical protein
MSAVVVRIADATGVEHNVYVQVASEDHAGDAVASLRKAWPEIEEPLEVLSEEDA